jgi:CheY-like chemotaxis protein
VINLTCNAAEAMGQGGTIRIATENRRLNTTLKRYEQINPGQYAVLTVEDQGGGIEPEDLARIFEPFHTSKKMGQGGTGLGMAVVWGTVKDHDGFIDCASQKGQGARFELYFPATADPVQEPTPHTPRTPDVQGRGEKILIIDDSREQRELAAATLKELGYATATAATGEEGAALLAREPCALVLLDMMLGPGIDGLNTYRRIREQVPQQKVVIVSGYAESERVATALRLGVREYLKKPYAIAELGQTVRRVLDAQG